MLDIKKKIMLELEKFGLVELSAQEQVEIDGGIFWFILAAALLYSTAAY